MTVRQTITAPLAGALQSAFAGGGLFGLFHEGGIVGERTPAVRYADYGIFDHAPRYHGGGFAGSGLRPEEVPIAALVRLDGVAEIIQFQDAVLEDGVYTLSNLLRGRRGTEVSPMATLQEICSSCLMACPGAACRSIELGVPYSIAW